MRIAGYIYMLKCRDGSYYVGSHRGEDVEARVFQHNMGADKHAYTFTRRPVELVWSDYFYRYDEMVACERQIKGWSRKKKEALIGGDSSALKALSKRGFRPAQAGDLNSNHPSRREFSTASQDGEISDG